MAQLQPPRKNLLDVFTDRPDMQATVPLPQSRTPAVGAPAPVAAPPASGAAPTAAAPPQRTLLDVFVDDPNGTPSASYGDMGSAALEAGAREAVGGLGFMGGARLGAMAPVPLPAKILTGLAGGIMGYLAGNSGVNLFEDISGQQVRSPDEFPQELQPAAYAGATLGGGISTGAGMVAIAKTGARAVTDRAAGRFLNRILDNAATRPGMFMTAEGTAAASAALAEGLTEYYVPDQDALRSATGIVGGAANPAAHLLRGLVKGPELVKNFFTKTAEIAASRRGTPEDLKTAAVMRHTETRKFFDELIKTAEDKAANLVGKMRVVDDNVVMAAEYKINQLLDESIGTGRRVENVLAARATQGAYGKTKLSAINTLQAYEELLNQRFMGSDKLPRDIESFLRMTDAELKQNVKNIPEEAVGFIGALRDMMPASGFKVTSAGDLIKLRIRALRQAKVLSTRGIDHYGEAEALGQIAEAALDDLSRLPKEAFGALTEYTDFAHLFNERFSQPILQSVGRRAMAGKMRIPPELIGTELVAQGNIQSAQHYADLRKAIGLSLDAPASMKNVTGVLDAPQTELRWKELMEAQQVILKNAAAKTINPETGKVDAASLAIFRRENGALLKQFPELSFTLANAQKAQRTFENVNKHVNQTKKGMNLVKDLVDSDDPVMAVAPALFGKDYKKAISQLSKTVKKAGGDAPEGLFSTVVHASLMKSSSKDGLVSMQQLKQTLDGRNNILDQLLSNGIIDANRSATIRRFLDKSVEQEKSRLNKSSTIAGMMGDFVNRLSGINAASRFAEMVGVHGGGRLAVASMGSRLGQKILGSVPDPQTADMLAAVLRSPEQMENMLRATQTTSERLRQFALLHGYLIQEGLSIAGPPIDAKMEEMQTSTTGLAPPP